MKSVRVAKSRDGFRLFGLAGLRTLLCFTIFGMLLCAPLDSASAAEPKAKNVLLLFGSSERDNGNWDPFDALVRARVPGQITFYRAYLESSRADEKSYLESQAETFRRTYAGVKLDLVITGNPEELQFAVQYRDKMFPGTDARRRARDAVVDRLRMPALVGRMQHRRIDHAGHLHVDCVFGRAPRFRRDVEARNVLADEAERASRFQIAFVDLWQLRRRPGKSRDLPVTQPATGRGMQDHAGLGRQLRHRHAPILCRRLEQNPPCLRAGNPHRHEITAGGGIARRGVEIMRARLRTLVVAPERIAVALVVPIRRHRADMFPIGVEFLGEDRRQRGRRALAELGRRGRW